MKFLGKGNPNDIIESLDKEGILIVVTRDQFLADKILHWIKLFDKKSSFEQKDLYLYRLNYVKAEDMANFLNSIDIFGKVTTTSLNTQSSQQSHGAVQVQVNPK